MPSLFRRHAAVLCACLTLLSLPGRAQQPAAPAASTHAPVSALTTPTDAAQQLIVEAIKKMNANDADGALNSLTQALKMNPNSTGAYVLRASIYCQKKQWQQAEDDFNAAARIAPKNVVVKFNLAEVKFMQRQYDVARPGFLALEQDPDMGDFATYKVFLCDLFGGHEDAARKELDVFNDAMGNPSYYFGNVAWDLVHHHVEDARSWLVSASHIYPANKLTAYAQSLIDLGYLPLPAPANP
jgi:tetratricopeptide (TPR) repeat protein